MISFDRLIPFVSPFYIEKDIMHDLSHIERMMNSVKKLRAYYPEITDDDLLTYGCYFHGFIYLREDLIREFLKQEGLGQERIDQIVRVAWECKKMKFRNRWKESCCTMRTALKAAKRI